MVQKVLRAIVAISVLCLFVFFVIRGIDSRTALPPAEHTPPAAADAETLSP